MHLLIVSIKYQRTTNNLDISLQTTEYIHSLIFFINVTNMARGIAMSNLWVIWLLWSWSVDNFDIHVPQFNLLCNPLNFPPAPSSGYNDNVCNTQVYLSNSLSATICKQAVISIEIQIQMGFYTEFWIFASAIQQS